ncbi:MAG: hypothetical protein GY856_20400 [bacterium]|nr:hypothetical protein [bacterium]
MRKAASSAGSALARFFRSFVRPPVDDTLRGLERCLEMRGRDGAWRALVFVGAGLLVGWWIYVPLHELLHAFGCLLAGGSVDRLEIDVLYGGALLARVFPFVVAGSDYAGRLSGFDTGGSDAVYLATDMAPFLLTLFPGVWALRRAGAGGKAFLFGFWLPFALAPFLSVTGDAYEIGSIVATQLPPWSGAVEVLRSDDLVRLVPQLVERRAAPWGGLVAGAFVGVLWAFATYAAGAGIASLLRRPAEAPA